MQSAHKCVWYIYRTESHRNRRNSAPEEGIQAAERQKTARVSAQYGASPSDSFCLLFLAQQKK